MSKLSIVFALMFGASAVVMVPACSNAYAENAPVFAGPRLLEMIPATGIVGDGATVADLYVLALDAHGAPLTGLALKGSTNTGSVSALQDAGGGLWRMDYTPPKVDASVSATLTLKGKIGKEQYLGTWSFPVTPSSTHPLSATANPSKLTLGVDKTATISIKLASGDRQSGDSVRLQIAASTGTVENITNLGGGNFSALYTAPKELVAKVALLTIVDKGDPSHTFAALAIPMSSKMDVPVTAAKNARVIIKIGDTQFGPIQVDSKGRAKVPVLLPPGVTTAEKIAVGADGQSISEPMDLKLPEATRIALMPVAAGVPSDSRLGVAIHAAVVTPDGRPDITAQVVFAASAGSFAPTRHEGNGIFGAVYTPPSGGVPTTATLTASLADRPTQSTASPMSLVSLRPGRVELTSVPAKLAPGAETFTVTALVTGTEGTALPGRAVTFGASGARLDGGVKDTGKGAYIAVFNPTGKGPVQVNATVGLPVTGNPMWRLLVVPSVGRVSNDGLSSLQITVAAIDEFGYPVPNVAVTLRLTGGDGSLPTDATTNASGLAQVYYTSGRQSALVGIEVASANQVAVAALLQAPDELTLPAIPVAGSRAEAALVAESRQALGEVRIERE